MGAPLCDCLQEILDDVLMALVDCDLDAPQCNYVSAGRPSVDSCPMMAVWLDSALTPNGQGPCKGPMRWRVNLGFWSCWPTVDENGKLPDCEQLTECACDHYCFVEAINTAFCEAVANCGQINSFEIRQQEPGGGCVGTVFTATITR